jgi:RecB family endonuclease NucS
MGSGNILTISRRGKQQIWTFANKKEAIEVKIHKLISDTAFDLDGSEPGLERQNTEHHLQAWIAANPQSLGTGWEVLAREYATGAGPVDILARDAQGQIVAVEVKRTAMLGSVDQAHRYVEALNRSGEHGNVRGLVAALDVRPNTRAQADKRDISWVEINPADWQ